MIELTSKNLSRVCTGSASWWRGGIDVGVA